MSIEQGIENPFLRFKAVFFVLNLSVWLRQSEMRMRAMASLREYSWTKKEHGNAKFEIIRAETYLINGNMVYAVVDRISLEIARVDFDGLFQIIVRGCIHRILSRHSGYQLLPQCGDSSETLRLHEFRTKYTAMGSAYATGLLDGDEGCPNAATTRNQSNRTAWPPFRDRGLEGCIPSSTLERSAT